MGRLHPDSTAVVDAIRSCAENLGHVPSRSEFMQRSGMAPHDIFRHFPNWREAVRAAGLEFNPSNQQLSNERLLEDWATLVRRHRQIPTRAQYKIEGGFSPNTFEKHFGPWSTVPRRFLEFAKDKSEWTDVVALLPATTNAHEVKRQLRTLGTGRSPEHSLEATARSYAKLDDRPTYGNPIDFRGLRHEPVNEDGVVFLFGMVARELGYLVEIVQAGFPDCEAKRQIAPDKWQRVRIEFEFDSRNFRDHGHDPNGCDIIVCWRHSWTECPANLEVLELSTAIRAMPKSAD